MTDSQRIDAAADKFCGGLNLKTGDETWLAAERVFKSGAALGQEIEREKAAGIVNLILVEYPLYLNCKEHEFEPNLTMDYFRCDKCGIRPMMAEALAKYESEGGGK
jgi:hypothetical protein